MALRFALAQVIQGFFAVEQGLPASGCFGFGQQIEQPGEEADGFRVSIARGRRPPGAQQIFASLGYLAGLLEMFGNQTGKLIQTLAALLD